MSILSPFLLGIFFVSYCLVGQIVVIFQVKMNCGTYIKQIQDYVYSCIVIFKKN